MMFLPAICLSTNITATSTPFISPQKPTQTPSNLLKSLSKSGKLDEALHLIESNPTCLTDPNLDAYSSFLHSCISKKSLHHGQRLYLQLLLSKNKTHQNLLQNPIIKSKIITLYTVCGEIDEARRVFDDGKSRDEAVWVAMAIGYSRKGLFRESLELYCQMLWQCVWVSNFGFSTALKACSELGEVGIGRMVHAQIVKAGDEVDQVVFNSLLRLYNQCGCFDDVVKLFDEMPQRNVVTWNSLIDGLVKRGQLFEAFRLFRKMQVEGTGFSWVTLTTVLSACAKVTAIYSGKEIHTQIVKSCGKPDVLVLNSLVDVYAKCGEMDYCSRVFRMMVSKDVTTYNTVLKGYTISGFMTEAIKLFAEMIDSGYYPDEVTFIALLSGCSHAGFMNEGKNFFERMSMEFGIKPTLEHYACLVDLLGRSGRIKEALEVVKKMPMKPSSSIWGSLLNSCRFHGNVSLAELIATKLFELEPSNLGNYVMLSNIYAKAMMWDNVKNVRKLMENEGLEKEPGCSWMQVKHKVHTFVASGSSAFRDTEEFRKVWNDLTEAMERIGYVPDTRSVLHDVNDEMKTEWVCGHSERLATMFGLIHTGSRMPIRITKNLRVCLDCHIWMKYVSKVMNRVIILRDTNRFHHFKQGSCSCKDFW
ncbi:pentatricopeptide repeat-containing protein At3g14330 [Apium graveolens]|uniref:pentatricopeptide repeat-containing protein At3g14330 n=1 Tax=Apium graveolens TaxID=4045 RepID=UPI003D78D52E